MLDVWPSSFLFFSPARGELVWDSQMIEDAGDDGVHYLFDALGAVVERRVGGENRCASLDEELEVLNVDQVERCLARDEDELLAFLQHDVGGAQENVVAGAVRNPAQGAHAARDDDHRVGGVGAAGEGGVHTLEIVRDGPGREAQATRKFLGDDRRGVTAKHDVNLVLARIKVIEQALGVERPAGSGDGDKYSQKQRMVES